MHSFRFVLGALAASGLLMALDTACSSSSNPHPLPCTGAECSVGSDAGSTPTDGGSSTSDGAPASSEDAAGGGGGDDAASTEADSGPDTGGGGGSDASPANDATSGSGTFACNGGLSCEVGSQVCRHVSGGPVVADAASEDTCVTFPSSCTATPTCTCLEAALNAQQCGEANGGFSVTILVP